MIRYFRWAVRPYVARQHKRRINDRKSKESFTAFAEQPNVGRSVRRAGGVLRDQFVLVSTGNADRFRPWRSTWDFDLLVVVGDDTE